MVPRTHKVWFIPYFPMPYCFAAKWETGYNIILEKIYIFIMIIQVSKVYQNLNTCRFPNQNRYTEFKLKYSKLMYYFINNVPKVCCEWKHYALLIREKQQNV